MSFYDRTNDAGGGAFYSRTNDSTAGSVQALGALASVTAAAPGVEVIGFLTVTMEEPFYFGHGSIFEPANFTGTPVDGATIRHATTNGFTVLSDGTIYADVNTGSYLCYYDEGLGEIEFTVTIDDHADAYAAVATATAVVVDAIAVGGIAGAASGELGTVTVAAPTGTAYEAAIASCEIGQATSVAPAGSALSQAFAGQATGAIGLVTAVTLAGRATGAAIARGALDTVEAGALTGSGNETGVGLALGLIGTALAVTVDAEGRAQWGRVEKNNTIWTRVN